MKERVCNSSGPIHAVRNSNFCLDAALAHTDWAGTIIPQIIIRYGNDFKYVPNFKTVDRSNNTVRFICFWQFIFDATAQWQRSTQNIGFICNYEEWNS